MNNLSDTPAAPCDGLTDLEARAVLRGANPELSGDVVPATPASAGHHIRCAEAKREGIIPALTRVMIDQAWGLMMNRSNSVLPVGLGVLLLTALVVGGSATAEAKSDYEIINTGIKGGGCWYDDNHFIVVKGHQPAPGQEFEVEGLYSLDPHQPKTLIRIDLAPLEPSQQKHIHNVSCQEETILFDVMAPDRRTTRLYGLKVGQQPELLADLRWARPAGISLKGKYVLGNKLTVDKGVWEEHSDCEVRSIKPGIKALCWPNDTIGLWVTPQFVVHEYLWRETVLVRGQHGATERVPNAKSPLKLSDGRELKQGYLLRDLENRIVQEIPTRQGPYQLIDVTFRPDPQGQYLYSVCSKAGDHGDKQYSVGGRICRFLLDGKNQTWEEVVSVQQSPKDPFSLHDLAVNAQGDVVAIERGHRLAISLWKYTAHSDSVEKLDHIISPKDLRSPLLSPSGHWVSLNKNSQLVLIERKGATP